MRSRKRSIARSFLTLSLVSVIVLAFCVGAVIAASKLVIHVNIGIGGAKLGMKEKDAVKAIGKPSKTGKDSEYEGRVVYFDKYGKANKSGEYPLEIYCDTHRKVFMFAMNSSSYPTDEGIKVGSTEDALKKAYGKKLKSKKSRVYTRYWLGDKTGTDFYVKSSKVTQIIVHSY